MKKIKRVLLGDRIFYILISLMLVLLVSCSAEPIEEKVTNNTPPITDVPVVTPTKYYNLQWRSSDCNINRILIVNGVQRNINLGFGEEFIYNKSFKSGDVIQLKITSNGCSSNVWTNQVVIWEWNNPEHQGQHIVKSKSCNNCTTLTLDPFTVP